MADRQPPAPGIDRARLQALVHAFYADLRRDAEIGPLFERAIGSAWPAHLDRMVEFWATMVLGSRSFSGDVFGRHMAIDALFEPARAAELQGIAAGIAGNLVRGLNRRK